MQMLSINHVLCIDDAAKVRIGVCESIFPKKDEGFHKKEFSSTLIYIYIYYVLAK